MAKVDLLGVFHQAAGVVEPGGMISEQGEETFCKEVLPRITDETLIVSEGASLRGVITRSHTHYRALLRDISPNLAASGKTPKLIYDDVLAAESAKKQQRHIQQTRIFTELCSAFIELHYVPASVEDMVQVLGESERRYSLAASPTGQMRDLAKNISRITKKRNASFTDAIDRASGIADQVFFLGGAAHAVDIHHRRDWQLQILWSDLESKVRLRELYWGCLIFNSFPQAIIEASS
jgi:hypothetical protein